MNSLTHMTRREIAQHPFIAGTILAVFGVYILAFVLIFAVLYVVAAAIDMLANGHR